MQIQEHNATTGKVITRDMTPQEQEQYNKDLEAQELKEQERAENEAKKESAKAKLAALGLTPQEIAAITGA